MIGRKKAPIIPLIIQQIKLPSLSSSFWYQHKRAYLIKIAPNFGQANAFQVESNVEC